MPTSARPLEIARLAAVLIGEDQDVRADLPAYLHLAPARPRSSAWMVPFSTATECPHRSASVLSSDRPPAGTKNEVPAEK